MNAGVKNAAFATAAAPSHHPPMAGRVGWTREQLLIALRLQMRLPLDRLRGPNPEIISLTTKIGRTPGALAMKARKFAGLDLAFRARRPGLSRASEADRTL